MRRAGSASVISGRRVRFRAATRRPAKKLMRFHPLRSDAMNAYAHHDRGSGHHGQKKFCLPSCPGRPPPPAYRNERRHPSAPRPSERTPAMTALTVSAAARPSRLWDHLRGDARHFQIAALATLLTFNFAFLDFGARPLNSALAILCSLATQAICSRVWRLPTIDLRSPLITGLSLSLLLRADEPWVHALAAAIAIGSKFVLRIDHKHIWNPAGF